MLNFPTRWSVARLALYTAKPRQQGRTSTNRNFLFLVYFLAFIIIHVLCRCGRRIPCLWALRIQSDCYRYSVFLKKSRSDHDFIVVLALWIVQIYMDYLFMQIEHEQIVHLNISDLVVAIGILQIMVYVVRANLLPHCITANTLGRWFRLGKLWRRFQKGIISADVSDFTLYSPISFFRSDFSTVRL